MSDPITPLVVSAPVLALLTMELVKFLIKKFIIKDPDHDFPPAFYGIFIPFLTGAWGYALAYVGWADPVGLDSMTLVQWLIACFLEAAMYVLGVQPLKDYAKLYRAKNP